MRILLVEDDPFVATSLESTLTEAGHKVRRAKDGIDGLEIVSEFPPDVILTDRRMPRMDGVEFARAVRASGLANHVPLVLLSGHTADLSASERAPFALILEKPIPAEEVLARVQEVAAIPR